MKTILFTLGLLCISMTNLCQNSFDPKVVVLSPRVIISESGLDKNVDFFEQYLISYEKNFYVEKRDSLIGVLLKNDTIKTNEREHLKNIIEFAPYWNFNTEIVHKYVQSMQSVLSLTFDNHLVIADSCKSISESSVLKEYAEKKAIDYIVNIDTIFLSKCKNGIMIKPALSVYYKKEDQYLDLHTNFNQRPNVFYVKVKKKKKYIFYDDMTPFSNLMNFIRVNGDSTKRIEIASSKELETKRSNILDSLFQTGKRYSSEFLQKKDTILQTPTSSICTVLRSKDGDKIIAYFVGKQEYKFEHMSGVQDAVSIIFCKKVNQNWEYQYVSIIMSFKEITQEEKVLIEFMKLIKLNFFKENSYELNDKFWDEELFLRNYKNIY